jgi:hypothetical protein
LGSKTHSRAAFEANWNSDPRNSIIRIEQDGALGRSVEQTDRGAGQWFSGRDGRQIETEPVVPVQKMNAVETFDVFKKLISHSSFLRISVVDSIPAGQ